MVTKVDGPTDDEMMRLRAARAEQARRAACYPDLLAALVKISTAPEGVYSRDKETYLKNVIAWCQETAATAIAKSSPQVR